MATPTTISTYITQAVAQGVTYDQLAASLKYMAISAAADDQGRIVATGVDGATIAFSSMDALFNALATIQRLALADAGPRILAPEFAPAGFSGSSTGFNS